MSLPLKKHLLIFFPLFCGVIIGATIILSTKSTQACMITNNATGECAEITSIEPTSSPIPTETQPQPTQEVLGQQEQPTPTATLTNNNTNTNNDVKEPCK